MIRLLIMDVDGTLTDGGIYLDCIGNEMKRFDVKDGAGIKQIQKIGVETMLLTGRESKCVTERGRELAIEYVFQGIKDKKKFLKEFSEKYNISLENMAYIGDDYNDLESMKLVGYTACPSDASQEVKDTVNYVCSKQGGYGAVREYVDYIIKEIYFKG